MKKIAFLPLFVGAILQAQSINIGNFYYRDYLDFGQNKGSFNSGNPTLIGKDGTSISVPNMPNFAASSNNGSLTAIGRGFVVTANHVTSPENPASNANLRKWGLTEYTISGESFTSQGYGRDEKFFRFDKYIVEGQADMLNVENSITSKNTANETTNIENLKKELDRFAKDSDGNVYIYQTGSGVITLRGSTNTEINRIESGETRGGGFGTLGKDSIAYNDLVRGSNTRGMLFNYYPNLNFNNRITSGDSGSGIYAYDTTNQKWILVGVVSQEYPTQNRAYISFVSNKDFEDYQKKFEQKIILANQQYTMNNQGLNTINFQGNKDIIFSGGGDIEVTGNIYRNISGQTGGFVFEKANKQTLYTFTNNGDYFFTGSGLDIGENVIVEWALRNKSGESLHKIGKGELIVKTAYTGSENLGYLKLGEGKVTLDTTSKAFNGVYITSGRGEVALKQAEAIGATKNTSANSYILAQNNTNDMGFYFGTGGGKFDLAGNSLRLNAVAANDSKAIITNLSTSLVDLEIEGFGYDNNGTKTSTKANTIIHASFGETNVNGTGANLNLIYKDSKTNNASLIFDGHIDIKGELKAENSNIVLQGHPTAHATISDEKIRSQVISAENGTAKPMPECMDLSKVSQLCQSDWDSRNFVIEKGIELKNATLTIGKAAKLTADISADNTSQINFGGTHFIDKQDTKNVRGSGFDYYQVITSGELANELYKDSSYNGTISANGTTITSSFFDFSPNLALSNGAKLKAKYLTLNINSTLNLQSNSTATITNLVFQGVNDLSKITLDDSSKFEVKESFTFDKSTFDLKNLQSKTNLALPTEYNLYAFNSSIITASEFKNTKENAQFEVRDSSFSADSMSFDKSATMLLDKGTLTLTQDLQTQNLDLNLLNSSTLTTNSLNSMGTSTLILEQGSKLETNGDISLNNALISLKNANSSLSAQNLTLNDSSNINLQDNATLTLTNALTSKDLTLSVGNKSTLSANTLNASGKLNLNADENSSIKLSTLHLQNGTLQNISQNVAIDTLNLTQSSANLANVNITKGLNLYEKSTAYLDTLGQIQSVSLKNGSNLHFDELNLNTNTTNLTSDDNSIAHIKRLSFDAQTNLTMQQIPQSNLVVSELFQLDNVGKNLGQTTGSDQEKLDKDLLALELSKTLELQNNTKLEVNFAELVKKDNQNLQFDKDYMIFTAKNLIYSENLDIKLNFVDNSGTNFFAKGKFDNNAFFVEFVKENPRNFDELNSHINPTYSALLEILLEHNQFDESIEKAINMGDYGALNQRLARLDTSFTNLASADNGILKTLPLLQKQEINARIQQNRFTRAKFALAGVKNPAQKSDIVPTLLYFEENERKNRAWSNVSASFFANNGDKFTLQSISIGYDRKLFGDEFLLGVMASLTNAQLSSNEMSLSPKIYTLALYSDALFARGELQNELSFSLLNGDKNFENEDGSYKSFHSFFESVYKVEFAFLPKNLKPLMLARVNLTSFDDFSTTTYKQKGDNDISMDLGLGLEWLWQKESGFYSATFMAERDVFHTQKEAMLSLSNAQKFIAYETNEPSFSYQLYLSGLENFKNGFYLRYGLSAFIDSKAYKGIKGDVQVGYKF